MKRTFLFIALAALFVATSYAGSNSGLGSGSTSTKKEAPERQGWFGSPLYGDVESVTITNYNLSDKFGEIVKENMGERGL